MEVIFEEEFTKNLEKYRHIRKQIKKKVDMVIKEPIKMGEPLKGVLRGFYSTPVKKNFLIIYLYCKICRKKGDDSIVVCQDCNQRADETLKFVNLGPHDKAYWEASKL